MAEPPAEAAPTRTPLQDLLVSSDDDPADSRDISDLLAGASDLRLGESRPAPSPSAFGRDSPSVRSAPPQRRAAEEPDLFADMGMSSGPPSKAGSSNSLSGLAPGRGSSNSLGGTPPPRVASPVVAAAPMRAVAPVPAAVHVTAGGSSTSSPKNLRKAVVKTAVAADDDDWGDPW